MSNKTLIVILTILFIALVVTIPLGHGPLVKATLPIRQATSTAYLSFSHFFAWMGDVQKIIDEKNKVTEERNELLSRVSKLEAVERQNHALREQLGVGKSLDQKLTLVSSSGIIDKGSAKYLLLNKGQQDGLEPGQIVISNNVLVGIIEHVDRNISFVAMPITAGSIIPAAIHHENGTTRGIVKAGFNLTAQIDQVLPSETLEAGGVIVTSGEGGTYPANLVIGKVGHVVNDPQGVFKSATIEIPWSPIELETVFVISK